METLPVRITFDSGLNVCHQKIIQISLCAKCDQMSSVFKSCVEFVSLQPDDVITSEYDQISADVVFNLINETDYQYLQP